MCVIIIKDSKKIISESILKKSSQVNPHGLGVIWLDDYSVTFHSSKDYDVLKTSKPFIAHFRYATVGEVSPRNCHPFSCGRNTNEMLMMNGTIHGLGNKLITDTQALAMRLGGIKRKYWKGKLESYNCRFVTANKSTLSYEIYNRKDWVEHEGVLYSKANVLPSTLVAVYGTLKYGYSNYHRYLSEQTYIGSGKTASRYPLVIKGLPYVVDVKGKGYNVEVDLFEVSDSCLKSLDRLEGHPEWYRRKKTKIIYKGQVVEAWLYFNNVDYKGERLHQSYKQNVNLEFEFYNKYEKPKSQVSCAWCSGELVEDMYAGLFICSECDEEFSSNELFNNHY